MAGEPITITLSLHFWQPPDGPWRIQLINCRVEKPPEEDRHQRRRVKNRGYQRKSRARRKEKAALADSPAPVSTVSTKERKRESVSTVSTKERENPPPPVPGPADGAPGNGQAVNPTQIKLKERLAALQARVQRRGTT
jgi:hypothetical protein